MAVIPKKPPEPKPPSRWRGPLHVLTLFLLAAGLVVGCLGFLEADRDGQLSRENLDSAWANVQEGFGLPPQRGLWLLVIGTAGAFVAFLFEGIVFLPVTALGRSQFGLRVVAKFALLLALLVLFTVGVAAAVLLLWLSLGKHHLLGVFPGLSAARHPVLSCLFPLVSNLESRRWR